MSDILGLLGQRLDAWTSRNPAALAEVYADDALVTSPMFPRVEGRAAIERSFESLFRVFPDWAITFEDTCISGQRAMQLCQVRATHRGEFMGIPGTGRRMEFDCVLVLDFKDGFIQRERRIYDFTGMLIQVGVLRGKPAI